MQIFHWVRAALCCLVLVASACASGPKVRVDMDPTTNLRSYKTFAFFEPASTDSNQYTTLVSARLKQSTRAQLERLGFVYEETDPQLRVNFYLKVVEKQQIRTSGGGYYGYRGGRYGTWAGYPYVDTVEYREGTLAIDLVDVSRKQLVWQGVAEGEVQDDSFKAPGPAIDQVVAKIFSNFPYAPK